MESLFSSFKEVNLKIWKDKLIKDLKGITFEELIKKEDNGLFVFPFYNSENQKINSNGNLFHNPDWDICMKIEVEDVEKANHKALEALNGGASGLIFSFKKELSGDFFTLLKEISIRNIFSCFEIEEEENAFLSLFHNYLNSSQFEGTYDPIISYDPIASYLKTMDSKLISKNNYQSLFTREYGLKTIAVAASIYQNAGVNSVTQLALGLSHLNEYLTWLDENNLLSSIEIIHFKVAVGTSYFEEIAKLRALRLLLPSLLEVYSIQPKIIISAETSGIYRTEINHYNNILRDSIAGMAAILGGCDNLFISNFNQFEKDARPEFGERIARNQQLIFKEESYFNKVADPASGSFYIETLTIEIAEKAWSDFQNIEQSGGLIVYFQDGTLLTEVNKQAKTLIEAYKKGERSLVGINKYQNKELINDYIPTKNKVQSQTFLSSINLAEAILKRN